MRTAESRQIRVSMATGRRPLPSAHSETVGAGGKTPVREQRQVSDKALNGRVSRSTHIWVTGALAASLQMESFARRRVCGCMPAASRSRETHVVGADSLSACENPPRAPIPLSEAACGALRVAPLSSGRPVSASARMVAFSLRLDQISPSASGGRSSIGTSTMSSRSNKETPAKRRGGRPHRMGPRACTCR